MVQHLDADTAALAALGERLDDPRDSGHVAACLSCQREIDSLRFAVSVARLTVGERELQPAPAHVWHSIRAELGLSTGLMPPPPMQDSALSTLTTASAAAQPVQLDAVRERRSGIRRFIAPMIASAAAAAIVAALVITWGAGAPRDPGVTLAAAQLEALPAWSGSTGQATVNELADGERVITVSLDAEVDDSVVREVWLLTENVDGLISLGLLTGSTGTFAIPASVDLAAYSVVDISAEPLDGDPTHSGDSIVRGALGA